MQLENRKREEKRKPRATAVLQKGSWGRPNLAEEQGALERGGGIPKAESEGIAYNLMREAWEEEEDSGRLIFSSFHFWEVTEL